MMADDLPRDIVLHLRPLADTVRVEVRLRKALKYLLRACKYRCVGVEWAYDDRKETGGDDRCCPPQA
jgi:hypothetical protein